MFVLPFHTITMADPISSAYTVKYGSTDVHRRSLAGDAESFIVATDASGDNDADDSIYKYWLLLLIAIMFEVAGTTSMKLSDGLTKLIPTIMIYVAYVLSFIFFPLALKRIDLSTAYAIWSGLGTTLTCVIGFVYFGDIKNLTKILALLAIIAGCVVLKFAD